MQIKDAISTAKNYVRDIMADEEPINIGLEEIEFNENNNEWEVTIGFSRPWNSVRNAMSTITGESAPKRAYRVFFIKDDTGEVRAMKRTDFGG
ncbi:hypothetical protein [Devosia naphthalenivorans]|uniref:hypothetical protein n=1 Tax=Devosia naphthalenivorans TaxID=2082392 RepID=UPI0013B06904|nr:hypothetical protein [Devosia naphthalenivorans]